MHFLHLSLIIVLLPWCFTVENEIIRSVGYMKDVVG